ncbi:MAG: hypothetical protein P1P87_03180 [Trueperaceae bacterium]|nr:hypothetical protein [Trueperaceae bacterium]
MMRSLRTVLTAVAATALLSACTVTFTPGDVGVNVRAGVVATVGSPRVDARWPVTVPPGARVADVQARGDRLRYDLIGSAGVRAVYDRLHAELAAAGWRRTDLDVKRREIEADYRRGGLELEAEVAERGRDRVRVTLERDD